MDLLQSLFDRQTFAALPVATVKTAIWYGGVALVFAVVERAWHGLGWRRYLQPSVINDYLYCVFFNAGYFTLLAYPFVKAVEGGLAPYGLDVLRGLPLPLAIAAFFLIADFSFYWAHRLLHTRWLWPFHRVHHSQTEMTYLTTARFHVVDVLVLTVVTLIPATLVGWPAETVVMVSLLLSLQDRMQHAALDFTYGPFYRVVVSPRYHRIHHAEDGARGNSNYARLLPIWDRLFGTAHADALRPERVGVPGEPLPENLLAHFLVPFRDLHALLRGGRALRPALSSPSPAEAAAGLAAGVSGSSASGEPAARLPLA